MNFKIPTIFLVTLIGIAACDDDEGSTAVMPNVVNGLDTTSISADFDLRGRSVQVLGANMFYVDEPPSGSGDETFLLLHGQPTSSYLWRNVIPHLRARGRVVAPDLIGMGQSDKPDIDYTLPEHIEYVNGFVAALGLEDVILVVHDWGGPLGFNYANTFPDNVRGIVFMETLVAPAPIEQVPPALRAVVELANVGERGDTAAGTGWRANAIVNDFIELEIPALTLRELGEEVMEAYRAPYPTVESRLPVWQWPRQVPIVGVGPDTSVAIVQAYFENYLTTSQTPKLFLYAEPGVLANAQTAEFFIQTFPNTTAAPLGAGLHYVQEDQPHRLGLAINAWVDATY